MNEKNKKLNVQDQLENGDRSCKEAEILFEQNLFEGAVSRAYYAAFHYTLALLLTLGLEPQTHEGAIHLFNVHFIRKRLIESEYYALLRRTQKWRLESDYKSRRFSRKETETELQEVKQFMGRILTYLKKEEFTS